MKNQQLIKFIPSILIMYVVLVVCLSATGNQQFTHLSDAFLHHHLSISDLVKGSDTDWAIYGGKYFWPEGPLPAFILMPFVLVFNIFHLFFYQGYLQIFLILLIGLVVIKLARKLDYDREDSLILSLGFLFGSMFIGVAIISSSWFFSQVITVLLLFSALYEYYSKKRWWLIGLYSGLLLITRGSALPIALFFLLEVKNSNSEKKQQFEAYYKLLIPIILLAFASMIYNFLRFHSPLEQGYQYQVLLPNMYQTRSYGLFSLVHLPSNIYYALLNVPQPVFRDNITHVLKFPFIQFDPWGMSIFVTSPYLLWLFSLKRVDINNSVRNLLIATAVSVAILFTYYGNGHYQFGFRYALDFLPLVFVVFMICYRKKHKKLSSIMKYILLGSGLLNFYLVLGFVSKMPRP